MKATKPALPGVVIIEPTVFGDKGGYFDETFREEIYADIIGPGLRCVQDNHSQ